jgi:hypothetical protein
MHIADIMTIFFNFHRSVNVSSAQLANWTTMYGAASFATTKIVSLEVGFF